MNEGEKLRLRNFIQKLTIDTREEFNNLVHDQNSRLLRSLFEQESEHSDWNRNRGQVELVTDNINFNMKLKGVDQQ